MFFARIRAPPGAIGTLTEHAARHRFVVGARLRAKKHRDQGRSYIVPQFDEQLLREQHLVYDDESALIQSTAQSRKDLEDLFEAGSSGFRER